MIPHFGWRTTFQVLGVIFFAMTVFGAFLLKNPPAGYKPADWVPAPASKVAATTYDFTPAEVLRTPSFYLLWVAYAFGCAAGLMVISQLVSFAKSVGVPSITLASFGLYGRAGNAMGRILSGWMSDHLGRINVLRLMIGISMVAMPFLYYVGGNVTTLFAMLFIVYWCYGTQLSVNGSSAADFWGTKNLGLNYGMLFTGGSPGLLGRRIGANGMTNITTTRWRSTRRRVWRQFPLCDWQANAAAPGQLPGTTTSQPASGGSCGAAKNVPSYTGLDGARGRAPLTQ